MSMLLILLLIFFFLPSLGAVVFLAAAFWRLRFLRRRGGPRAPVRPPVTILLPACAADAELEANLRSFCRQDYPRFQVLFGVPDEADPAVPVIQRIMAEFPGAHLSLIIDAGAPGPDRKASSLASMLPAARHDLLILADSTLRVDPNWLAAVAAPFSDPLVGAVTSPCCGAPRGGLAADLGALALTDWILPAILLARWRQAPLLALGAALAVRRQALESAGGFPPLIPFSAEDRQFCRRLRRDGWEVILSPCVVEKIVADPDLPTLFERELRAARAIRACRPVGYAFSGLAWGGVSLALLFLLFTGFGPIGWLTVGAVGLLRLALHFRLRVLLRTPPPFAPLLLPLRDGFALGVWATALFRPKPGRSRQNLTGQPADVSPPPPSGWDITT